MMKAALVVVFLFVGYVYAGPFCPGEDCDKDGRGKFIKSTCDRCIAKGNEYKCGVFYKDLTRVRPLTWIGAIPDALNNDNKDKWADILGPNADKDDFKKIPCGTSTADTYANSRCYTILSPLATKSLDTCEDTLLNSRQLRRDTLGNYLCDQAIRFLKPTRRYRKENIAQSGLRNQEMVFFYSACGGEWKPVTDTGSGRHLEVQEDLCCRSNGQYEPCNGRFDYTQSCPQ